MSLALTVCQAKADVSLEKVRDHELDRLLRNAFVLPMLTDLPEKTSGEHRQYLEAEVRKLTDLLKSIGYLEAAIEIRSGLPGGGDIRLLPLPGDLFRIGWISTRGLPESLSSQRLEELEDFTARFVGRDATRDSLNKLEAGLVWRLRDAAYANAEIVQIESRTEPELRTAGFIISIDPGQAIRVGDIRFLGSRHIDILRPLAAFIIKEGDPYSASAIQQLRELLEETDLFSRIRIALAGTDEASIVTDLEIDLVEKPSESSALEFDTHVGPALSIFTMLLIILKECAFGTRWSRKPIEPTFTFAVVVFYATNIAIILNLAVSTLLPQS